MPHSSTRETCFGLTHFFEIRKLQNLMNVSVIDGKFKMFEQSVETWLAYHNLIR